MRFPKKVEDATVEYRVSQDVLGQFIAAMCESSGKVSVNELYNAFKLWAEQSRERHSLTLRKFGDELTKRKDCNVFRGSIRGHSYFHGISLRPSAGASTYVEAL